MASSGEIYVSAENLTVTRRAERVIAVVGNPNTGKSTVFNRLTGMRQKVANYPGVTVEKRVGRATVGDSVFDLVDLPGIYGLSPHSTDERIAVDVLLGRISGTPEPEGILAVVDATRLYQGLYLVQQLLEMGRPMIVVLTMTDMAHLEGMRIDIEGLSKRLGGIPIFPVVATRGSGFSELKIAISKMFEAVPSEPPVFWPDLRHAAEELRKTIGEPAAAFQVVELERAIIDGDSEVVESLRVEAGDFSFDCLSAVRHDLCGDTPPLAAEARYRYTWIREKLSDLQRQVSPLPRLGRAVINWFNQPWPSTLSFIFSMGVVFQAVFAWAAPLMDMIDSATGSLGAWIGNVLPPGMLSSFLVDGIVAGVGSVVIFLPQIFILFLFIILMEDTGYLARAAFLVDRAMKSFGLSGQSVVPLLSSFACAVPAIMATRVIPSRRDRIATILAAPFMTCSARLPVYALLIAAFVPNTSFGLLNLQGLVLFGLYLLGIVGGVSTALLLKRSVLQGNNPIFMLALPEFRFPDLRSVVLKLLDRARIFLRRAGTVIFAVAVVVWALAYFPRSAFIEDGRIAAHSEAALFLSGQALQVELDRVDNEAAAEHLAQSLLGRAGQAIEPVFAPLGWDWKVSAAVIAGFPAREVVVAVLGTIYAVGGQAEEVSLAERLQSATWPDGRPVYSLPMVLGLLVFYAWCLQCAATLAVIGRETNSWRWPVIAWTYMTVLGYVGALTIYQIGVA